MQVTEKGYIVCPNCKQRTQTKVFPNTKLENFPLYCRTCKTQTIINKTEIAIK